MKYELKSIRLWSFLKVAFFLNILVGFLSGFIMAIFTSFFISTLGSMTDMSQYGLEVPQDFTLGVLFILYPIMGAVFCAVFLTFGELLVIGLYNLIAKITGGLELNLNVLGEEFPAQQPIYAHTQSQPLAPPPPVTPPPPAPLQKEEPKPSPFYIQPPETTEEKPGRHDKPPDHEFPSRTVGG